jgi:hypothetical protein
MKVDDEYIPAGTVPRDLEKIYGAVESALPSQRTGDVLQ